MVGCSAVLCVAPEAIKTTARLAERKVLAGGEGGLAYKEKESEQVCCLALQSVRGQ